MVEADPRARLAAASRRLLTVPTILVLAVALTLTAPLLLPTAAAFDLLLRRRLATLRLVGFAIVYLWAETAGILASLGLWLWQALSGPDRQRTLDAHFRLQCWWAGTLFGAARRLYGIRIELETDADLGSGPVLVLLRHTSMADTLLGAAVFSIPHGLRLRYVLKSELLWDPCLDIVGHRLPNVFVDRAASDRAAGIRAIGDLAQGLGPRDGVLIYPEGTRFSHAKRERVIQRLRHAGEDALSERAERLRHVLPPRPAGTLALLAAAPEADVVICMHTGLENAATLGDFLSGRLIGRTLRVRCVRHPAKEIPDAPLDWLLERWDEVEAFVANAQEASD
jgi:1-acyl-sn-glycerol-3-phosphate acyltransferase